MPNHLRAKTRSFVYPVGADLSRVLAVGGLSKLPAEELTEMASRLRYVAAGEFCDDMPESSRPHYLERGDIEWLSDDPPLSDLNAK